MAEPLTDEELSLLQLAASSAERLSHEAGPHSVLVPGGKLARLIAELRQLREMRAQLAIPELPPGPRGSPATLDELFPPSETKEEP